MCEHCGCRGVAPIAALMDEHHTLRDLAGDLRRALLSGDLDPHSPAAASLLDRAVAKLSEHMDREDLGIFPVAVVTLGATGWQTVDRAHQRRAPAPA